MDITDAARRVGALAWTEQRLFELVGGWVATTDEPAAKLFFARASRLHGDHALALAEVLPDTRDHDPEALVAPGDDDPTAALEGETSTSGRLRALGEVLTRQVAALDGLLAHAVPVRDGPVLRVGARVRDEDAALAEEVRGLPV